MSIVITVSDEGQEKMYFRINDYGTTTVVERPDKASIHAPEIAGADTLADQVILAIEAIKKEDDKWAKLQTEPMGVKYPRLSDLDS